MHSPLAMQALAHFSDSSLPLPKRKISSTPETTALGSAAPRPAGAAIGQTSKHLPHLVQASTMSSTRLVRASSNPACCMSLDYLKTSRDTRALAAILRDARASPPLLRMRLRLVPASS